MNPSLIFFGTSHYAVIVLEALIAHGYVPKIVVTTPDRPAGKHLKLTPPPVKVCAEKHNLPILQPENLKDEGFLNSIQVIKPDVSIVVAYGKIIPQEVISIPVHGTLNVHASLLPKLRGASPIETSILTDERHTGVTVMLIDDKMDHGPIIAQKEIEMDPWPPTAPELGKSLVNAGALLLIEILPDWLQGKLEAKEQDHNKATFTKKIAKADGLIDLSADAYENFRKIQAYSDWPTTYFFVERNGKEIRVIIKKAEYKDGVLTILRVVPEGKKEMSYEDFKRSLS